MKTKIPEPIHYVYAGIGSVGVGCFDESQLKAAMTEAFNEGVDSAVDACLSMQAGWVPDVATDCADRILKLKEPK